MEVYGFDCFIECREVEDVGGCLWVVWLVVEGFVSGGRKFVVWVGGVKIWFVGLGSVCCVGGCVVI